ncbi:hypothetical protein AQUCO_05500022v1 [Aquilegia coerulea]|uniref:F-box domain-containing protein n=1 Tax=Aquilegia coerulea TaxID=218851 RepID=A0A2G5CGU3_AQUCA|nr:hypothetical protein AQUCO_05500022v1 [Aquilegia coerulea]
MPGDIMIIIFLKIDTVDLLTHVQFVCSSWKKLAKEPRLFHTIVIPKALARHTCNVKDLAKEAVDRSCGELLEFYNENYCGDDLLLYVVNESKSLRSFRVCHGSNICGDIILELARKHPLLEELEFSERFRYYGIDIVFKEVGHSCLRLKRFTLTLGGEFFGDCEIINDIALAIAENIPQLHCLRLSGEFSGVGCKAILDGCSKLECLDHRKFNFNVLEQNLLKNFVGKIKDLRLW